MRDMTGLARWCAAALLATPDGRYLMQLRDPKPGILLPDHWSFFGGSIDPGEDPATALRRELVEELEFTATRVEFLTEFEVDLPFPTRRRDRMSFFAVPITDADVATMVQHEGAGKRLFRPGELMQEPRVAPWDLAALLMHARRQALFALG